MTAAGWVFMLSSVTSVTLLMVWCFYRVLTSPQPCDEAAPGEDIDSTDRAGR